MNKKRLGQKFVFLLPVLAGIFYGSAGTFVRLLDSWEMDNFTIIESRAIFGVVMLFLILLIWDRKKLRIHKKDIWLFLVLGIAGMFLLNIFYNISIVRLSLSFSAVLLCLCPVYVLIFSAIFFKEKVGIQKIICVVLVIFGCVLVSGFLENISGTTLSLLGLGAGILSGICYAVINIASKELANRNYNGLTVTFYGVIVVLIISAPFADWGLLGKTITTNPGTNVPLLILHAFCVLVAPYLLINAGLARMDAGKVAVFSSTEPMAAMVFGWIFFSEIPSVLMIVGMILTIVALVFFSLPDITRKKTKQF